MFIAALFTIVKTWKQPKCPTTDEWIKKTWHIYTVKYSSAINRNEIMPFAAKWMGLEMIVLSEVGQKKTNSYDITYMWILKYNTNELTYEAETDSQI